MAKKLYEESNIQAIADAIREKNGETTTYKTSEMAAAITNIPTGGGEVPEVEPIVLTGACDYACGGPIASKYIELYGDKITTKNIENAKYMFYDYRNESVPFEINFNNSTNYCSTESFFSQTCLTTLPKLNGFKPYNLSDFFAYSSDLREIPDDYCADWDCTLMLNSTTSYECPMDRMFTQCYSLRKLPASIPFDKTNRFHTYSSAYLNGMCNYCYSLDEVVNLPLPYTSVWKSNGLNSIVNHCCRLKRFTFAVHDDGSPFVMQWKSQTLDLTTNIGYSPNNGYIVNYNSGITVDKAVTNDETYQALKNDPDWFTCNIAYSRYNHDSAVETINSLPDTFAHLATVGGTNTIKFRGAAGSATDGGAINTLTEEEIAVAAAKGWTVTFS